MSNFWGQALRFNGFLDKWHGKVLVFNRVFELL
jgi:hypothetical protein